MRRGYFDLVLKFLAARPACLPALELHDTLQLPPDVQFREQLWLCSEFVDGHEDWTPLPEGTVLHQLGHAPVAMAGFDGALPNMMAMIFCSAAVLQQPAQTQTLKLPESSRLYP